MGKKLTLLFTLSVSDFQETLGDGITILKPLLLVLHHCVHQDSAVETAFKNLKLYCYYSISSVRLVFLDSANVTVHFNHVNQETPHE